MRSGLISARRRRNEILNSKGKRKSYLNDIATFSKEFEGF